MGESVEVEMYKLGLMTSGGDVVKDWRMRSTPEKRLGSTTTDWEL